MEADSLSQLSRRLVAKSYQTQLIKAKNPQFQIGGYLEDSPKLAKTSHSPLCTKKVQ
jgi:hypothetical protein